MKQTQRAKTMQNKTDKANCQLWPSSSVDIAPKIIQFNAFKFDSKTLFSQILSE